MLFSSSRAARDHFIEGVSGETGQGRDDTRAKGTRRGNGKGQMGRDRWEGTDGKGQMGRDRWEGTDGKGRSAGPWSKRGAIFELKVGESADPLFGNRSLATY